MFNDVLKVLEGELSRHLIEGHLSEATFHEYVNTVSMLRKAEIDAAAHMLRNMTPKQAKTGGELVDSFKQTSHLKIAK